MPEKNWTFEAGDRVPDWLMRQINCVLWFDRDAVVVESGSEFQIYPASLMDADDTMVLAEIIDQQGTVNLTPREQHCRETYPV